eukprot:1196724-Pyramimonas_sp.AAC.1
MRYTVVAFLHMFSGTRRAGDSQECLEFATSVAPYLVTAIFSDVAIDPELGDLTQHTNTNHRLHYLWDGHAIGVLGARPCETWSGIL